MMGLLNWTVPPEGIEIDGVFNYSELEMGTGVERSGLLLDYSLQQGKDAPIL